MRSRRQARASAGGEALRERSPRWSALPLALLLASLSCAGQEDAPAPDRSADTAWGDSVRAVEELRLGALEAEGPELFSEVVDVAVDADGGMWVGDEDSHEIRYFGPDGGYRGTVGGEGEGPGEFERLEAVVPFPDGRIGGWDYLRRRLVVFDGLTYQKGITFPRASPVNSRPQIHVDAPARIYIRSDPLTNDPYWLRYTEEGELLDSLAIPPSRLEGGGSTMGQLYPLGPMATYPVRTMSYVSPGGYLVEGRTDEYVFRLSTEAGVRVFERPWEPVSVDPRERASFQAVQDFHAGNQDQEPTEVPDRKPAWWQFWIDEEERLWVARHGEGFRVEEAEESPGISPNVPPALAAGLGDPPPRPWWEPLRLDVFDPEAGFLGTVTFPNHQTSLEAARGRTVWGVEVGPADEHYVVRYRLESR